MKRCLHIFASPHDPSQEPEEVDGSGSWSHTRIRGKSLVLSQLSQVATSEYVAQCRKLYVPCFWVLVNNCIQNTSSIHVHLDFRWCICRLHQRVPTPRHPGALYSGELSTFHTDLTTSLQLHQDIISNLLCWTCCILTDRAFLINHIFVPCSMKYFRTKKRGHHY